MNFELIKNLKGAGFSLRQGDIEIEGVRYDLPSLEELIEACPTNLGKATFVLLRRSGPGVGRLLLRFYDQSRFRFQ
jgi:hypothetical protein